MSTGRRRGLQIDDPLGPGVPTVLAALAELFSGGLVGHNHEIGLWWVA